MIATIFKKPKILVPTKQIILISHMRANTSLLGHIIGSHPSVSGYYEQHIGYYSWKSLIRLRLKFSQENPKEKINTIFFDKVLHSDHAISSDVFGSKRNMLLFVLRKPEKTIKSIVAMYQRMDEAHPQANVAEAGKYYIDRVKDIASIAKSYEHKPECYYMDAETIIENADSALNQLTSCFNLTPELTPEYEMFELTGKKKVGDSSDVIKSGKINTSKRNYDDIIIPESILAQAEEAYSNSRNKLIDICSIHIKVA